MDDYERFWDLFKGRPTARGTENGGSISYHEYDRWHHWDGTDPIGVYPMVYNALGNPDWFVKWGCVDLDVKRPDKRRWDYEKQEDAYIAAQNLQTVLRISNVPSYIELTRSRGYHVWVFAEDWVPAATMRRALLYACSVVDVPPTEVNPKSEGFDDPQTLGNYVRLPYPGEHGDWNGCRVILHRDGAPASRTEWLRGAHVSTSGALSALAERYDPPPPPKHQVNGTYTGTLDTQVTPYIAEVLRHGPMNDEDRSGWLYWLARKCRDEGLDHEVAFRVLQEADATHTHKFTGRNDADRQLARTVERGYR